MVSGSRAGEMCGVVEASMLLAWHGMGSGASPRAQKPPESTETLVTHVEG